MSSDADFLAEARGRLQQLKSLHDAGRLDAKTYDAERRAVEQEIGAHLLGQTPAPPRPRPSSRMVAGLVAAVAVVAIAGYLATGSPALVAGSGGAAPPDHAAAGGTDPAGNDAASPAAQQQIAAMVDKLAARMKERPDDVEGWIMLARSYTVLGRYADAVPAYARATELQPQNASLLADYADTVAATKRTANNPESIALIERALAIDPGHPKALALAGTVDFDRGDYARAIARWQSILERVPAESELGQQIAGSIADARAKLGGAAPPATASASGAGAAQAATASASAGAGATQADRRVRGARRQRHGHARSRARRQGRARRHRVRVRPRRRRRPDAARDPEGPGRRPALALQARRQHGDGARHDRLQREAGDRRRPHQQVGPGDAERRRPLGRVRAGGDRHDEHRRAHRPGRRHTVGAAAGASAPAQSGGAAPARTRLPRRPSKRPSSSISPARSASRASGLNSSASTANTGAPL